MDSVSTPHPESPKKTPSFRWKRWLAAIAIFIALLFAFLAGIAPGMAQRAAADWARGIGRQLTLGEVSIHPWSMTVEVKALKLAEGDGKPLFSADRVFLDATPRALLIGRWQAAEFSVDKPQLWVERDDKGEWNWARFIKDASGPPKAKEADDKAMPRLLLESFRLRQGAVYLHDKLADPDASFRVSPLNIALTDVSTLPEAGGVKLHAGLQDGTRFDWKGSLELQPLRSSGDISMVGLKLATVWDYIKPSLNLDSPKGELSASVRYRFDMSGKALQLTLDPFSAQLKGLEAHAPGTRHELVLPTLQVSGGKFDLASHSVNIASVALNGGRLDARRMENGVIDWLAAVPAGKSAPSQADSKPSPWRVKVDAIRLSDWHYRLEDAHFAGPLAIETELPLLQAGFSLTPEAGFSVDKLSGELKNLQLGRSGQNAPLRLASLKLGPSRISQKDVEIAPGEVTLAGLQADVRRERNGAVNLAELFKQNAAPAKAAGGAGQSDAKPGWKLKYPLVTLADSGVSWTDQTLPRPVTFALKGLGGKLLAKEQGPLDVQLDGMLETGKLSGHFSLDPASGAVKGKLSTNQVPLAPLAPYGLSGTPLRMAGGLLSANLDIDSARSAWKVAGDVGITQLSVMEPGQKLPLLGWRSLKVDGLALQANPLKVAIRDIRLEEPVARVILDQQRQLNFQKIFAARAAGKPAAPVKPAAAAPLPPVEVRSVHMNRGRVEFADQSMNPNFRALMHHLRGSVQGLSTQPGRKGTVTLNGDVDQYGDVRVRGALAPLAVTDDTDITLSFRNIPLSTLNPYSTTFAGWRINDGRLTVDLRYLLEHRQLKGENRVVLDTLQLGEEVPDYKGTRLPLRLAVALLEDSDGRIDLDLPVSGSLDDPQFSYGQIVWKAVVNVVTKIVTAPFRALGALIGGDGFDNIYFVPGEASVTPPEREKLEKVAGVMSKRPKMMLELSGGYDASVDGKELARARIDAAVLKSAGRSLLPGEPLPVPDLADPAMLSALKTVYAERIGRIKLMSHTLNPTGPSGAALAKILRAELIANEKVDEAALQALARQRAENARRVMMRNDNTLGERIKLADPVKNRAERDGVPLGIKLSGK